MRLAPGTRVGPYEVVATLGTGGMAEVYRARDSRLQREVALKVVGEALSGDGGFLARLEHEARLAGSLNHPNIVAVHDVGSHEGAPYVVTELLQGETLRQRLSRGQPPLSSALDWGAQIAQGLAAAHEHGIVHRDLKPENVFLTRSGHVKLLDFGIAKAALATSSSHDLLEPTLSPAGEMTRTGAVLGTPGYMSPEQVRGEPVDGRSDIFSFGAILYEMLSGRRAFPGASVVESGHATLHDDPPPLPETVPAAVVQLVRRCLEKDPGQRFQSARDVGFALEVARTASGGSASLVARGGLLHRRRLGLLVIALAGALGAGVAGFIAGRGTDQRSQPEIRPLTFRRGSVLAARFAPDGHTIHYSASWTGGPPQVFSTTIDSPEARPLGIGEANLLAVSPSGELAVSLRPIFNVWDRETGTLARVPAMGGRPRELVRGVTYADWAPDGDRLAVAGIESDGTRLEFPLGHVLFRSKGWVSHPRVSSSGDRIAFIDHDLPGDSRGVVRVVSATGAVETWSPLLDPALGLAWAPDGKALLVSGAPRAGDFSSLWILRARDQPRLLYRAPGDLLLADARSDGRLLVVLHEWRQEIEVLAGAGRTLSPEWAPVFGYLRGVSDDGNSILMWDGGQLAVALWDRRHAVSTRIGKGRPLALSHEGEWALVSDNDVPGKLTLLPTGAGTPKVLGNSGLAYFSSAAFFPDGKRLALIGRSRRDSKNEMLILDLAGGPPQTISEGAGSSGPVAVSTDQRWVAATSPDGVVTMYSASGERPVRIDPWGVGVTVAGWLSDGTLLAQDWTKVPSPVTRFDPRSGAVRPFTTLAPTDPAGVRRIRALVSSDGRTVAFDTWRSTATLHLLEWKPAR